MKGQCCIVRPVRMPGRGHGDGRLIRWRSQAGRMLGEPVARWDAGGEFAATTAQVLGERVAGAQSAWTGGGLALVPCQYSFIAADLPFSALARLLCGTR
jgi:hypothetical protein